MSVPMVLVESLAAAAAAAAAADATLEVCVVLPSASLDACAWCVSFDYQRMGIGMDSGTFVLVLVMPEGTDMGLDIVGWDTAVCGYCWQRWCWCD